MVLVQVDDLAATRKRAEEIAVHGVRSIDLGDIAVTHLHPKDLGAITSVDQPVDPASWRLGGPGWEQRSVPGRLRSVTVGGADPTRWMDLLDRPLEDGAIHLDDGTVIAFATQAGSAQADGVISVVDVGGTTVTLP